MQNAFMRRRWKALITLAIFTFVLFRIPDWKPSGVNWLRIIWAATLVLLMAYAFSLFLKPKLPFLKRLGIGFLAAGGITYLLPSILGWGLVANSLWDSLISPYLVFSFFDSAYHYSQWPIGRRPYCISPGQMGDEPYRTHYGFAAICMVLSLLAIFGAIAISRSLKIGTWIWSAFLAVLLYLPFGIHLPCVERFLGL
jgi:hypothetical protein